MSAVRSRLETAPEGRVLEFGTSAGQGYTLLEAENYPLDNDVVVLADLSRYSGKEKMLFKKLSRATKSTGVAYVSWRNKKNFDVTQLDPYFRSVHLLTDGVITLAECKIPVVRK